MGKTIKEYEFYATLNMTILVKVNASNIEEAVEKVSSMSEVELLKHEIFDVFTIDFESV